MDYMNKHFHVTMPLTYYTLTTLTWNSYNTILHYKSCNLFCCYGQSSGMVFIHIPLCFGSFDQICGF